MSEQLQIHGSLNRLALSATIHCLTGCAIGEVMGMVVGIAASLSTRNTIILSVILAFLFGYYLSALPLLRSGVSFGTALKLAFASDTVSILIMEIVDNTIMLFIPGAMEAGLDQPLFWLSLFGSLIIAGAAAFPVVRYLISRGRGHAVVHKHHAAIAGSQETDSHSHHT